MKKLFFCIMIILCCFVSTGCKKDKNDNETTSVVTYEITEEKVDYFEDSATTWDDIDQELNSISPEYLEELEYNSRKNVYPEGMD